MYKVVSLRPEDRFNSVRITIPPELEIVHCAATDETTVAEACSSADYILGGMTRVTARVIERATRLKFIQQPSAGYDAIDVEAATRAGIPVANVPDANSSTVAEYVFVTAMMLFRRIAEANSGIRNGNYAETRARLTDTGMFELKGKTIGIVGLGRIGRDLAQRARAFEMRVLYYDVVRPTAEEEQRLGIGFAPMEEVLGSADILTLHVPLVPQTANMIGAKQLALLRPNSIVINASRGGIVDEAALADALREGKIAGAAVDVFSTEPLPPTHPFFTLAVEVASRLILTPHIAGVTRESSRRMLQTGIDNIARVARASRPLYVVNYGR